jgi:hypothetical protein
VHPDVRQRLPHSGSSTQRGDSRRPAPARRHGRTCRRWNARAFKNPVIRRFAEEIASDERQHVTFLRGALGSAAVARPTISLDHSFTRAARAAGLIGEGEAFDVYASEANLLFAAYLFEDVDVTTERASGGGFYPDGFNGDLTESADS